MRGKIFEVTNEYQEVGMGLRYRYNYTVRVKEERNFLVFVKGKGAASYSGRITNESGLNPMLEIDFENINEIEDPVLYVKVDGDSGGKTFEIEVKEESFNAVVPRLSTWKV